MNKQFKLVTAVAFATSIFSQSALAQSLFTIGNRQVSKKEFLIAYNKNPKDAKLTRSQSLQEYLDMFINFKLKVVSAYDDSIHVRQSFKNDVNNFKQQLSESFINEEADLKKLMDEAAERAKIDIHAQQILIEFGNDSAKARVLANEAVKQLKAGKPFSDVLAKFGTDENNKKSNGDLGFITVFNLPYIFENEIYALKPGQISEPVKGKYGFHIFKQVAQRKAIGKRKIAQILIALPENPPADLLEKRTKLADTVYQQIIHGVPFEKQVAEYSNDLRTIHDNGILPLVGIGEYNKQFEDEVFALKEVNQVSKPFRTAFGFHIIKLLEKEFPKEQYEATAELKDQIEKSGRLKWKKQLLLKKWQTLDKFTKHSFDEKQVWAFVDSSYENKSIEKFGKQFDTLTLFSLGKTNIQLKDFTEFIVKQRNSSSDIATKPITAQYNEFEKEKIIEYYKSHLDEYNPTYKQQLEEFKEANLLFLAMEDHVWSKASTDTVALKNYYNSNSSKYMWGPSVQAILFTVNSKSVAEEIRSTVKANPDVWREVVANYSGMASADSNKFEISSLPIKQSMPIEVGSISNLEKVENEDIYNFLLITQVNQSQTVRSFEEAKGLVINDYQKIVEQDWIKALRKKYKPQVNQAVWQTIK